MFWIKDKNKVYDSWYAKKEDYSISRQTGFMTVIFEVILRDGLKFDVEISPHDYYDMNGYYLQDTSQANLRQIHQVKTVDGYLIDTNYIMAQKIKEIKQDTHTLIQENWFDVYYTVGFFKDKKHRVYRSTETLERDERN